MIHLNRKMLLAGLIAGLLGVVGCGDDDDTDTTDPMDMGPGMDMGDEVDMQMVEVDGGGEEPRVCTIDAPTPPASAGCPAVDDRTEVVVSADITTDATWTCDNLYVLDDQIYITDDATLTIEAGVVVHGGAGGDEGQNALIVTTEGSIDAAGTSVDPIVFTSANPEGDAAPGDWGGVVLLGRAPINVSGGTNLIEGLDPSESRGEYGGDDAAHDCGTLNYVRIEYAGFLFGTDNELNGLTIGGCGTDTDLDFIHVHAGKDDGIEFFGGTAGIRHAVISQVGDDGLDWDEGWQGDVQFLVIQQDAAGDRGIEADNLGSDQDTTPRSSPTIWNMTIIGASADNDGLRLREGTGGMISNSIIFNYPDSTCSRVDNSSTIRVANDGDLVITDSIVGPCSTAFDFTADDGDTTTMFTGDWDALNDLTSDPMMAAPTNLSAPNFLPNGFSPAGEGYGAPSAGFDTNADFAGALEPGCWDWTSGWTAYPAIAE